MAGRIEYSVVDFSESLTASFIGSGKEPDERYSPRILCNDAKQATSVLSVLKRELRDCISFDFSVAFLTSSGIQTLADLLSELKRQNVPGRILTSTYLNFNDPDALRKLLEYPNIETRIYQGDLHAKGYFFDKDQISTIIIGSSNLTQTALTCNKEWNVLFRSFPKGTMLLEAKHEFEKLWEDEMTVPIKEEWISAYESYLRESNGKVGLAKQRSFSFPEARKTSKEQRFSNSNHSEGPITEPKQGARPIRPNAMQKHALEALDLLHRRDEQRALLISATGTGKTYLSALDVQAVSPTRILFIAHRRRILDASLRSFRHVLGNSYSYGMLGGGVYDSTSTCVFAMASTLARRLDRFRADEFDYIIIDEAHRSGSVSYRAILNHFTPKFCLGMTATPSRTDGYDVYELFNHVIAFRITLQDALESDLLVPFHYFGIADLAIDDEEADDIALFSKLTSEERVRHIVEKIEEYSVQKTNRKGLIFCSRNEEAAKLSEAFNQRGYRTRAISGSDPDARRDETIAMLEKGELQYIFSVDILNEGIDIPTVNQIIMLRKTNSAIIFVQQLGRGLRKHAEKDYTLVLDFIGNYQQNFLIPIALSGDRTYNKDNLRRVIKEGSTVIPGCSTITFDRVAEKRIFKALELEKFSNAKLIKSEYDHLKLVLGRIPTLLDFDVSEAMDPLIIIKKYGSYANFLQQHEKERAGKLTDTQLKLLRFISQKLASGKRLADLKMLKDLIDEELGEKSAVLRAAAEDQSARSAAALAAAQNVLSGAFSTNGQELVTRSKPLSLNENFRLHLHNPLFLDYVLDVLDFGISRNDRFFSQTYKDTDFVLNEKYTREEVCRFLRWSKEPNYQNIGGYFHDKETNTFPVFINYDKDPGISLTTQYEDRFVSERRIIAISKSKRTLLSPEINMLANAESNGVRCFLFLRKNKEDKDDGTEFYFLGEIHPIGRFSEITLADGKTKAVEITYDLESPVRADLYEYFLSNLDED